MQVIYRVCLVINHEETHFDFIDFGQACKFADAAKVNHVNGREKAFSVHVTLLSKEEVEEDA